jgi:hypothetical protein
MTVSDPAFPSSKAFDLISEALKDEVTRKEMMKTNAIFGFDLTSPDDKKVRTAPIHQFWATC